MLLRVSLSIAILFTAPLAMATWFINGRTGITVGEVGGPEKARTSFNVVPSFDGEIEYSVESGISHLFRMAMATSFDSSQNHYFFAGYGQRYYPANSYFPKEQAGGGTELSYFRKLNYFGEWRVGVSKLQGKEFSEALVFSSTAIDAGGGAGMVYWLSNRVGLQAVSGVNFAMGFTSVSLTGMIFSLSFGVSYIF